ncbi:hypothetical protein [Ralstonia sp. ASV6]|uniref:hypothetical protein n=1 Tax=Ralstonia sp. ASV6 TaxID=2795124 RepID=UPI0018ECF352|nr:hypothetical protein [Ralstonia sp. ASV6]
METTHTTEKKPTLRMIVGGGNLDVPLDQVRECIDGNEAAQALQEMVTRQARDGSSKRQEAAVAAIEKRAALWSDAYFHAKLPELNAQVGAGPNPRLEILRRQDVEVVSTRIAREWAALDAADFRVVRGAEARFNLAISMESVRSRRYLEALEEAAPDVLADIRECNATHDRLVAEKEDLKSAQLARLIAENPEAQADLAIISRHAQLTRNGRSIEDLQPGLARRMAEADLEDYAVLVNDDRRQYCAGFIAANMRNAAYREAVERSSPLIARVIEVLSDVQRCERILPPTGWRSSGKVAYYGTVTAPRWEMSMLESFGIQISGYREDSGQFMVRLDESAKEQLETFAEELPAELHRRDGDWRSIACLERLDADGLRGERAFAKFMGAFGDKREAEWDWVVSLIDQHLDPKDVVVCPVDGIVGNLPDRGLSETAIVTFFELKRAFPDAVTMTRANAAKYQSTLDRSLDNSAGLGQ